jgi:IS30 family transposase
MPHSQITIEQRFKIQSWLELCMSQTEIAARLEKNQSSISVELKLNSFEDGHYEAQHAQKLVQLRRKAGRRTTRKLVKDKRLRRVVINCLRRKDSPEQIVGKRKRNKKDYVVHETIYQYIYTERPDLIQYLRRKKNRFRRRHGTKMRQKLREYEKKTWITERPEYINNKTQIGHWEGDTIKGKERTTGIATHVERVSGYALASKLEHVNAETMHQKTVEQFKRIPKEKRISETNDNGSEFADFEYTERVLGMKMYFALPYHSWERGTNENWNSLLRQFFPKGTPFATVSQKDVDRAVRNLNNRPRKRLNYLSPYEVFVKGMVP